MSLLTARFYIHRAAKSVVYAEKTKSGKICETNVRRHDIRRKVTSSYVNRECSGLPQKKASFIFIVLSFLVYAKKFLLTSYNAARQTVRARHH